MKTSFCSDRFFETVLFIIRHFRAIVKFCIKFADNCFSKADSRRRFCRFCTKKTRLQRCSTGLVKNGCIVGLAENAERSVDFHSQNFYVVQNGDLVAVGIVALHGYGDVIDGGGVLFHLIDEVVAQQGGVGV